MKTADTKHTATPAKTETPFFQKGEGSFFSATPTATFAPTTATHTPPTIQTKLTIGQPDDEYEKEADSMADKVVQKLSEPVAGAAPPDESSNVEAGLNNSSNGFPLPPNTKGQMESSFGHDFSSVRLHTDNSAVQMNQDLHAQAFTHGSDIYFNQGKYDTDSQGGQHLLGHELTHVVQQGSAPSSTVQRAPDPTPQPKVDKAFYELIPTSTLHIDLNAVTFVVQPEATFSPGPKTPQLLGIMLKKLVGDQYNETLLAPMKAFLVNDSTITKGGHFKGDQNALANEKIGTGVIVEIEAFIQITDFLTGQGLKVQLTDTEKRQIKDGHHDAVLWGEIVGLFKQKGPVPIWYDKLFFDKQMEEHMQLLQEFGTIFDEFRANRNAANQKAGTAKIAQIFVPIYEEFILMEAIRTDASLQKNPDSKIAFNTIWWVNEKGTLKTPTSIRSYNAAFELLRISRQNEELTHNARKLSSARTSLLQLFAGQYDFEKAKEKVLQPFDSLVVGLDINPDNTTVPTAKNLFRMVTDFDGIHGTETVHAVNEAMHMNLFYSWNVFKMPESLKKLKGMGATSEEMVKGTNDFIKNSPQNLGEPVDTYEYDRDRDQNIKMSALGIGDFVVEGIAVPNYTNKTVQLTSHAGYPFSVIDAQDLAKTAVFSNADQIAKLKQQEAAATDPDIKTAIQEQIKQLEKREGSNLLALTKKDMEDTEKLLAAARRLKDFIEQDKKGNLPYYGSSTANPFIVRLSDFDPLLLQVYKMIRESYPTGSDEKVTQDYIKSLEKQDKDLLKLKNRSANAYDSFKEGAPTYRVLGGLVKEDDGNLVPLIMVAGYHKEADPQTGKYKMMLVDVTFDAPNKGDMIYVGSMDNSEEAAVASAFDKFAGKHHYGKGRIVYRLPGTSHAGNIESYTPKMDYLEYAIAALGMVLLVAGVLASGGLLAPAAAAVVSALGVAVGVAGAIIAARHISERKEKGVFKWDAETALDIVNIIAGALVAIQAGTRLIQVTINSVNLMVKIEQARNLLIIYDMTNIGANVYLVNEKVKDDIAAIESLDLKQYEKDDLLGQIKFQAIQQGAMLAVSAYNLGRGAFEGFKAKAAGVTWHSWEEKGWIAKGVNGKYSITGEAPPFLRAKMTLFGTTPKAPRIPEDNTPTTKTPTEPTKAPTETNDPADNKTPAATKAPAPDETSTTPPKAPPTFEEQVPAIWKDPKARPGRLDATIKKLRELNIADNTILNILKNIAERTANPSKFFGDFYTALVQKNKDVKLSPANLNTLLDGLASSTNFESAAWLMTRQSFGQALGQDVGLIMSRLSLEDIAKLRATYPSADDAQFKNSLDKILGRINGDKDVILGLLKEADPGKAGLEKLERAVRQLGEGVHTPEEVRHQLGFEARLQEAINKGADGVAKQIFGDKLKGKNANGQYMLADSLKDQIPGDEAAGFVNKRKGEINRLTLDDSGKKVDPIKWGIVRSIIDNSDLPTETKNNIRGEIWTSANVEAYGNQGYKVIREVSIRILDKNGKPTGKSARLDAVLVKGDEILYKEFKSSDTAKENKGTQDVAYKRLNEGDISGLKPYGPRAEQAFGGPDMPNFKARPVSIERPSDL